MNKASSSYSRLWYIASITWVVLVISAFLDFNPMYLSAWTTSPFVLSGFLTIAVGGALIWGATRFVPMLANGIGLWLLSLVLVIPMLFHFDQVQDIISLDLTDILQILGKMSLAIASMSIMMFSAYAAGDRVFTLLTPKSSSRLMSYWKIGIGLGVLSVLSFLLGALGLLQQWSALGLLLLAAGQKHRTSLQFIRSISVKNLLRDNQKLTFGTALLLSAIICTISLNIIYNLKAFPIGWDALSYYLNITQQIAETQSIPKGYQAYNASILASLPYLATGYFFNSVQFLMLGGVLSMLVIRSWVIDRSDTLRGNLSALWFITLPTIAFLSTKDVKIDLILLFILVCAGTYTQYIVSLKALKKEHWILLGMFCGFALGIKYTALFFIAAILCVYVLKAKGAIAATVSLVGLCGFFMLSGVDSISGSGIRFPGSRTMGGVLVVAAAIYILKDEIQRKQLRDFLAAPFFLLLSSLVFFSPWMIKNGIEQDNPRAIRLLFGKGNEPRLDMDKINQSPSNPESIFMQLLETEEDITQEGNTSRREEIQRFIGYEKGALKFITLPTDLALNFNERKSIVHIGFLILIFLPLLYLRKLSFSAKTSITIGIVCLLISLLGLSAISYIATQSGNPQTDIFSLISNYNADYSLIPLIAYLGIPMAYVWMIPGISSAALAYPIALILIAGGAFLYFKRVAKWKKEVQHFGFIIFCFACMWWLFGGGIIWYGYFMVTGMIMLIGSRLTFPDQPSIRNSVFTISGVWIVLAIGLRLAALDGSSEKSSQSLWVAPMIDYASGDASTTETLQLLSPVISATLEEINMSDSRIYRVGTFMPYFITKNGARIYNDNQLDGFNTISSLYDTRDGIVKTLYNDGFRYIILDLNTASIDKTPDQSLKAKFNAFMNFVYQNPKLQLMATDRRVMIERNGQQQVVAALAGRQYVNPGSIAVFKIMP